MSRNCWRPRSRDFTEAIDELDRETDLEAQRWLNANRRVGLAAVVGRMIGNFWQVYFTEKRRRDGVEGLFAAVQSGMHPFLSYAKHWEKKRKKP